MGVTLEIKMKIVQEGALDALNALLGSTDVEILREVGQSTVTKSD